MYILLFYLFIKAYHLLLLLEIQEIVMTFSHWAWENTIIDLK